MFIVGRDSGTNPAISGWRGELKWAEANPTDGVYNWTRIDALLAIAAKYNKQLGLSVVLLSAPPPWVTALPGVRTYQGGLASDPMVLPFDPIVQPKIITFITALCQHYDNQLDYIVMGGLATRLKPTCRCRLTSDST